MQPSFSTHMLILPTVTNAVPLKKREFEFNPSCSICFSLSQGFSHQASQASKEYCNLKRPHHWVKNISINTTSSASSLSVSHQILPTQHLVPSPKEPELGRPSLRPCASASITDHGLVFLRPAARKKTPKKKRSQSKTTTIARQTQFFICLPLLQARKKLHDTH